MAKAFITALTAASIIAGFGGGYAIAELSDASAGREGSVGADAGQRKSAAESALASGPDAGGERPKGTETIDIAASQDTTVLQPDGSQDDAQLAWDDERVVFLGRLTVPVERPFGISYVVADIALAMSTPEEALALRELDKSLRLRDAAITEMKDAATSRMMREEPHNVEILSKRLKTALEGHAGPIEQMLMLTYHVAEVPRT